MPNFPTGRSYFDLRGPRNSHVFNLDWDNYPIHGAGMAVFIANSSLNQAATVSIVESADGATWTPVLFSTPTTTNQLNVVVGPQAARAFIFVSSQKFVRVKTAQQVNDGVFCYTCQYPPPGREGIPSEYA